MIERESAEAMTVAEWSPLVDISEDEKEYLVKAELPEVKKLFYQAVEDSKDNLRDLKH